MMRLSVQPEKDEDLENAIDSQGQMRFFDELGRKCDTFSTNLSDLVIVPNAFSVFSTNCVTAIKH